MTKGECFVSIHAQGGPEMASVMIKVAGEGLVAAAHRLADPGPTTGSSIIYEVTNVPDGMKASAMVVTS